MTSAGLTPKGENEEGLECWWLFFGYGKVNFTKIWNI